MFDEVFIPATRKMSRRAFGTGRHLGRSVDVLIFFCRNTCDDFSVFPTQSQPATLHHSCTSSFEMVLNCDARNTRVRFPSTSLVKIFPVDLKANTTFEIPANDLIVPSPFHN